MEQANFRKGRAATSAAHGYKANGNFEICVLDDEIRRMSTKLSVSLIRKSARLGHAYLAGRWHP